MSKIDLPTSRRMTEGILAVEAEHADDLADRLVTGPGDDHAARSGRKLN